MKTQFSTIVGLAAGLLVGVTATVQAQFQYTARFGDGTAIKITGYTGPGGEVMIPDLIAGKSVTIIGEGTFRENTSLISVTIPDSVISIEGGAFSGCTGLTSVTIGNSVTSIGEGTFLGCTGLTSITIPDSVTSIGDGAFSWCTGLTSVTIGNGVISIGREAFRGCSSVTSITIPDSVTSIGGGAFYDCTSLTSVTIGNGVISIGWEAFRGCSSLTSITIPDSVRSIEAGAFSGCRSLMSIDVDALNPIYSSFDGALLNKAATLFMLCPQGKSTVTIPNSVTSIEAGAFSGCTGLTRIDVDALHPLYSSFDGALLNKAATLFILCPQGKSTVTIPNNVTSIEAGAFSGCTSLMSIDVEALNPLYSSFDGALLNKAATLFMRCPQGKSSVAIPNSVTSIEAGAFSGCTQLTSVVIGNGVSSIGEYTFSGCTGLISVTIPDSVTSIGDSAFSGCTSLRALHFEGNAPSVGVEVFTGNNATVYHLLGTAGWETTYCGLPVRLWKLDAPIGYSIENGTVTLTGYTGPGGDVVIPDTIEGNPVVRIGAWAFSGCISLTSVKIPNSVTSIGDGAFAGCTNLTSIMIPGSVTSIGSGAFSDCTGLTSLTIPDSVISIGSWVFEGCSGLRALHFEGDAPSVGVEVFRGANATVYHLLGTAGWETTYCGLPVRLWNPDIPFDYEIHDGTVTITGYTGPGGDVVIPDTIEGKPVTSIGDQAFSWCTSLTSVIIGNSVTSIGVLAFRGCTSLTSVTIPDSVTSIGNGAFEHCTNLTSITIPNSVTSIEAWAFSGCTGLTAIEVDPLNPKYSGLDGVLFDKNQSILIKYPQGRAGNYIIPDSVISIRELAFRDCSSLSSITIPDSVTTIGNGAFSGCTSLKSVSIGNGVTIIPEAGKWVPGVFQGCSSLVNLLIGNSVTSIGGEAFRGCTSLTSVTIGNSVTSIGVLAFWGCTSLTSVTIPDSVRSIEAWAFSGCTGLNEVYFHGPPPSLGNKTFSDTPNMTVYYLPGTTGWGSTFGGRPAVLWSPMFQAHGVQGGCAYIVGDGATSITRYVGTDTEVLVPETIVGLPVTSISDWAFLGCDQVTSLTLPTSLTEIGEGAFRACSELASMVIPDNVTHIGNSAFAYCSGLSSIKIGNGLARIHARSFEGLTNLVSVTIGNGVTRIGKAAFKGCTGLTTLTIPDSVTAIEGGYDLFTGTSYGAFVECTGLRTVTVGKGVSYLGAETFYACRNLTSAYFRGSPPDLEEYEYEMFDDTPVTVCYLPGVEGWGSEFSGRPAVPGNAHLTPHVQPDRLRVTLTTMAGLSVLVEAGADLLGTEWTPLYSGTLTDGLVEIGDPEWAKHSARFYRVRSPE